MKRRELKWIAAILLMIMVFSLIGCSTQQSTNDKDTEPTYTENPYKIPEKLEFEEIELPDEIEKIEVSAEPETNETYYILNTSSHKFHESDCSYGKRTSEKNKKIS